MIWICMVVFGGLIRWTQSKLQWRQIKKLLTHHADSGHATVQQLRPLDIQAAFAFTNIT